MLHRLFFPFRPILDLAPEPEPPPPPPPPTPAEIYARRETLRLAEQLEDDAACFAAWMGGAIVEHDAMLLEAHGHGVLYDALRAAFEAGAREAKPEREELA